MTQALMAQALSTLAARKDQDCQAALGALRAELKAEVEAAYKERDEHLENYSKVRCIFNYLDAFRVSILSQSDSMENKCYIKMQLCYFLYLSVESNIFP